MKTSDQDAKKSSESMPGSPDGGLIVFDESDNFFDGLLSRRGAGLSGRNLPAGLERGFPKVDIVDHKNEIEVTAALPGIRKEYLDVSINNQTIFIRVSAKDEKKEEGKYFHSEITCGQFQRTLPLPANVDNEHVKASFKDGILKVTIPKQKKTSVKLSKSKSTNFISDLFHPVLIMNE